jgi:conjugal transfer pilus assembly protein TraU
MMVCLLFIVLGYGSSATAGDQCTGRFFNPITDICWSCLFPISIGDATVVSGDNPDTSNPSLPLQICPAGTLYRIGLAIGYWEPFAVTDVTRNPYCLVNLGGYQLHIKYGHVNGSTESPSSGTQGTFYQVHWYKYPLIAWLNIITSLGCLQSGDYDIGYISEVDPTWDDDELSFLIHPEDVLFANAIAQASCLTDALASAQGSPINSLFWCMGSQGSTYPLTGHISAEYSVLQNSTLLSERMAYKLHRFPPLISDSIGKNYAVCSEHHYPIMPKDRYRYELVNPSADANSCHPFGHTVTTWQMGRIKPDDKGNYGYLIWRKRNCVFL